MERRATRAAVNSSQLNYLFISNLKLWREIHQASVCLPPFLFANLFLIFITTDPSTYGTEWSHQYALSYVLTVAGWIYQQRRKKEKQKILSFLFIVLQKRKHSYWCFRWYASILHGTIFRVSEKTISFTLQQQQQNSATIHSLEHIFDRNRRLQSDASCTEFYCLILFIDSTRRSVSNNFVDMLFVWQFSPFAQIARNFFFFLSFVVDFFFSTQNSQRRNAKRCNNVELWANLVIPNEPGNTFAFMIMIVFSVIYCSRIYCKFSALFLFDFPFFLFLSLVLSFRVDKINSDFAFVFRGQNWNASYYGM